MNGNDYLSIQLGGALQSLEVVLVCVECILRRDLGFFFFKIIGEGNRFFVVRGDPQMDLRGHHLCIGCGLGVAHDLGCLCADAFNEGALDW